VDVDGDGKSEWVVTGLGKDASGHYVFQYYFLNASFQPLWGDSSAWRITLDNTFGPQIVRSYAQPGSWLKHGSTLVPVFLGTGVLPGPDNFDSLDPRHYQPDTHLYYLAAAAKQAAPGPVTLELRALDSATVRRAQGDVHLENLIPQDAQSAGQGHLRALLAQGSELTAPEQVWDIASTESTRLAPAQAWDTLSSSGQPLPAFPDGQSAFLNFYDIARGSIAWSDAEGEFLGRTEFEFAQPEDALLRLIGAFNRGTDGRYAFLESRFHLVAFHEKRPGAPLEVRTLPIQRDSSFPGSQFSDLFSPVPLLGVYVDSTLVVGNRVSIIAWNDSASTLSRPLRYSLAIPPQCVQMPPFSAPGATLGTSHSTAQQAGAFFLPLICADGTNVALHIVAP
jgi:hypothetical protein